MKQLLFSYYPLLYKFRANNYLSLNTVGYRFFMWLFKQIAEAELPQRKRILSGLILCATACFGNASASSGSLASQFEYKVKTDVKAYFKTQGLKLKKLEADTRIGSKPSSKSCKAFKASRVKTNRPPIGKIRYQITCGPDSRALRGTAAVKVWLSVVTAKRQIEVGEVVGKNMLTYSTKEITGLRNNYLTSSKEILGYKVKRRINKGKAIGLQFLTQPYLVNRGQTIQLNVVGKTFTASAKVEALANGKRGDYISVRNLTSGKIIKAEVVEKNVVETRK